MLALHFNVNKDILCYKQKLHNEKNEVFKYDIEFVFYKMNKYPPSEQIFDNKNTDIPDSLI